MKAILLILSLFILTTQTSNAQWQRVLSATGVNTICSFAANTNTIFACGTSGWGVWMSANGGANWTQTSLNNQTMFAVAANGNNIFGGTLLQGLYLSTNNGLSWSPTSLSGTVYSLAVNGNNVFAGTGTGVKLSTNNGTSWTQTSLNSHLIRSLLVNGTNIFAGTSDSGVFSSVNSGTNWTHTSLNTGSVPAITLNGNTIFAGADNGVYLSTNNGANWTLTSLTQPVTALTASGNNIFAGCTTGIYVSNNNGTSWTLRNEGINNLSGVNSLITFNNFVLAGVEDSTNSIYRRPLSDLIGIQTISTEIPGTFSLSQNYPNPFNPSTNFQFRIAKFGLVNIKIYDVQGKLVSTILNEELKPGIYKTDFDGSKFSSGVYFYKLVTNGFTETKKMLLVK